jgi:hypothetical protein
VDGLREKWLGLGLAHAAEALAEELSAAVKVVALGVRALEQGFRAAFYRLEEFLHEMRQDAAVSPQALRRKKYFNVSYLVVDEMGFEPLSQSDASLFFRLVSSRYRRGSTASTTNKGVKDWTGLLAGDGAMAAAILDRWLHKGVVLNVRGRSYRLQEREKVRKWAWFNPLGNRVTPWAAGLGSNLIAANPLQHGPAGPSVTRL